jgi:hypothetical protein
MYPVTVLIEDVERDPRDEGIAQGILLVQEISARFSNLFDPNRVSCLDFSNQRR